jgi:hypothetical protein
MKSAQIKPDFASDLPKEVSEETYLNLLVRQHKNLIELHRNYRQHLLRASFGALLTVFGCGLVTLTWLWFGGASESAPKVLGGP